MKFLKKWVLPILCAIILVLPVRMWIFAPYTMQSNAMEPTIAKGEYVFALKIGQVQVNDIVVAPMQT